MNTMLEQSARALAVAWYCRDDDDDETKAQAAEQWPGFTVLARAALQAIRVPTDEMDGAGFEALKTEQGKSSLGTCSVVFTAMIDAILSESTNP